MFVLDGQTYAFSYEERLRTYAIKQNFVVFNMDDLFKSKVCNVQILRILKCRHTMRRHLEDIVFLNGCPYFHVYTISAMRTTKGAMYIRVLNKLEVLSPILEF